VKDAVSTITGNFISADQFVTGDFLSGTDDSLSLAILSQKYNAWELIPSSIATSLTVRLSGGSSFLKIAAFFCLIF